MEHDWSSRSYDFSPQRDGAREEQPLRTAKMHAAEHGQRVYSLQLSIHDHLSQVDVHAVAAKLLAQPQKQRMATNKQPAKPSPAPMTPSEQQLLRLELRRPLLKAKRVHRAAHCQHQPPLAVV